MHEIEQMPARLAAFLRLHRDDVELIEVIDYEPMAGGYSRSMARARVRYTSGGVALEETVVLRGDPPAGHSMIDTDRDHEWRVLKALTDLDLIPIPPARYYDRSGEHLGTKAIVMDHVSGGSLQSLIEEMTDYGDHPTRLARLWGSIHGITPDQLPADMPRPASWEARIDELINTWRDNEAASVNSDPTWRYIAAWLDANKPPPLPLRLTHGDPQAPNVMVDLERRVPGRRLGVRRDRRPPGGSRVVQHLLDGGRPQPLRGRSGGLPGCVPRRHWVRGGRGQPAHGRLLHRAVVDQDPRRRSPPS